MVVRTSGKEAELVGKVLIDTGIEFVVVIHALAGNEEIVLHGKRIRWIGVGLREVLQQILRDFIDPVCRNEVAGKRLAVAAGIQI